MIAEAIEKIRALANEAADKDKLIPVQPSPSSRTYLFSTETAASGCRKLGSLQVDPEYPTLKLRTLSGLAEAIAALPSGNAVEAVHVQDHLNVAVLGPLDFWNRRPVYITAKHEPIDAFQFDAYYTDPEKFVIGLQVAFLPTQETMRLLKLVSALRAGSSVQANDNGFSQTLTVKTGEVTTADVEIEPRIKLAAIRTFPEVNPAFNEFLIRFKGGTGIPQLALFNVDGVKWKLESVLAIRKYLTETLPSTLKVIA